MVMPISRENLAEAVADAYTIANIYKLTVTRPSYFYREVAIFNERALKSWARQDSRFTDFERERLLQKINAGTKYAAIGGVALGTLGGIGGAAGAKALIVNGIIATPANPIVGGVLVGAGAVVGTVTGLAGGIYAGAKIGGLPSSDKALDAVYNSHDDLLTFHIFRSLLSPAQINNLQTSMSREFFCPLTENSLPQFPVKDTWKENKLINTQYYEYGSLREWIEDHPGKLNSYPLQDRAVSLNHATDYWPRLSEELQTNFEISFNRDQFEPNPENRAFIHKCFVQLNSRETEYINDEIDYPAGLYGVCKEFLMAQRRKILVPDR
ncbi:MAG: hypothetical protein JW769_01290 [Parachlamydiales bacterium]|nr:hypothetical protein [Parachlamydiales bacterium]